MTTSFNVSGHHVEVTDALHAYTARKLSKLDQRFSKVTSVHITLSIERNRQIAHGEVHLAGDQNTIIADATSDDMYTSIDELEHKLLSQVQKYHDKLKDHHKD